MATKPWSVAFAGTGDTSEANVKALLDDWLPQQLEHVTVPSKIGRSHKGVGNVKDWLEVEFGEETTEFASLADMASVLGTHRVEGCDPYLVFIPPEEWDEDSSEAKLVRTCIKVRIPVKDLTQGLDDFEPPAEAEVDPWADEDNTKEAEEKPTRRRGVPRQGTFDKETEAARIEEAQAAVEAAHEGAREDPPFEPTSAPLSAPETPATTGVSVVLSQTTIDALLATLTSLAADVKASVVNDLPASARPKVVTYPYWVNEDGEYRSRKGRGRPRTGEQPVDLTEAEVTKLGQESIASAFSSLPE